MSDGNKHEKIMAANRFALAYSKAKKSSLTISELMNDKERYKQYVMECLDSSNDLLKKAAEDSAREEGFLDEGSSRSGSSSSSGGGTLSPDGWKRMKEAAVEAAGPIGAMIVQKVMGSDSGSQKLDIIKKISDSLGGAGAKFREELNKRS